MSILKEHLEVVIVLSAFIIFMAFGDCIADAVKELAGDY